MNQYKYDIAISFVKEDEGLAIKLNDILKQTMSTFLYSERQKEIAGRDGEEAFNEVFFKQSRIVVVLYRDSWGKTPWTRMEETAIKNRAFDEGYDFTTFIPVSDDKSMPLWLPRTRLYLGLSRFGLDGVASVIESRVQEYGGEIKVPTLEEKIANTNDRLLKAERRAHILSNNEGRALSIEQFHVLLQSFKDKVKSIQVSLPDWHLRTRENRNKGLDMISYGQSLLVQFYDESFDTYLSIKLFDGVFDERGYSMPFDKPTLIKSTEYKFNIDTNDNHGWSNKTGKDFYDSNALSVMWIEKLVEAVDKTRTKQKK